MTTRWPCIAAAKHECIPVSSSSKFRRLHPSFVSERQTGDPLASRLLPMALRTPGNGQIVDYPEMSLC